MASTTSNPATLAARGAREVRSAGWLINPEFNALHLQVQRLVSRFGLTEPVARAVVVHAFSNGGRA